MATRNDEDAEDDGTQARPPPLSTLEKHRLAQLINTLPTEHLSGVIKIIQESTTTPTPTSFRSSTSSRSSSSTSNHTEEDDNNYVSGSVITSLTRDDATSVYVDMDDLSARTQRKLFEHVAQLPILVGVKRPKAMQRAG